MLQNILNNVNPKERKKYIIGNGRQSEIGKHQKLITLKVRNPNFVVVLISWASDEAQSWGRLQVSEGSMISLAKQSSGIADISATHPDQVPVIIYDEMWSNIKEYKWEQIPQI